MESQFLDTMVAGARQLVEQNAASSAVAILGLAVMVYCFWPADTSRVPALGETVPYVSNTYQYLTDMRSFLWRAEQALHRKKLAWFRLGPMKIYLTTGAQNVQAMFRTSPSISSDKFILMMMDTIWGMTKEDLVKFVNDKSGRLKAPVPGTEDTPDEKRYWASLHRILHDFLAQTDEANKLAESYLQLFSERLDKYPVDHWATAGVFDFLRIQMTEAAIVSLAGPRILEVNPGFVETFWEFDEIAGSLAWGLPKWMNRKAWDTQERIGAACAKYIKAVLPGFDWSRPESELNWEPDSGSNFLRELISWMIKSGFSLKTISGTIASLGIFAQNSNTIPVATWTTMELVKNPGLFKKVREEVMTAYLVDPVTQERTLDTQKLVSLPLFQSIYTEILRLHISINITREVKEPIVLEGYRLQSGSLIQAPSEIAHYDERVWSTEGHHASEFWAERHIKYVEAEDKAGNATRIPLFSMTGRTNEFFPYGGGVSMCPGRFFAKQEIMITVALLVSRFDIEFVRWKKHDGSGSDRAAENDAKWAGAAAMPPDRDMEVRWRRIW